MSIEDKLDKLSEASYAFHGEVRQYMANTTSYIGAVNTKLNNHLDDHREDIKESREGTRDRWAIAISLTLGLLSITAEIVRTVLK